MAQNMHVIRLSPINSVEGTDTMNDPHITKEVESFFGVKQVTRAEFVQQWTAQVSQFWHIATKSEDAEVIDTMLESVKKMAGAKWDAMK